MSQAFDSVLAQIDKLPLAEQEVLAAILSEEIASEQRWSQSFASSQALLGMLADEAIAEFKAGKTVRLQDLL